MNILDAIIIIVFILGIMSGLRRGLIKSLVFLIGIVVVLVISYYIKNPLSAFFYNNLPFFSLKGLPIFNIILYEILAFLIIFSIVYLALRILLKITGIIEKVLNATIILGFFSKIGGAIIGFIESYIIVFLFLFLFSQPFFSITGLHDSWLANKILDETPILSGSIENTRIVIKEIVEMADDFDFNDKEYNRKAIDLFVKYDIITKENLDILIKKGKIEY